ELTSPKEPATPQESIRADQNWPFVCLWLGCEATPFRRVTDLERHYRTSHRQQSGQDRYKCDRSSCTRGFERKDHFRTHLRDRHYEDIPKRGVLVDDDWFEDRYVSSKWWRCRSCLNRVVVEVSGFKCPECKVECEKKRREKRQKKNVKVR
ncbi:hypothetical protein BGZ61DRAFT_557605, partial [Ilyonectria robusta]|uniref:uncharacterized protein n=1 Tax=Ilyonectria robusta TaxID=1079257 RepID=UPI001E8DE000